MLKTSRGLDHIPDIFGTLGIGQHLGLGARSGVVLLCVWASGIEWWDTEREGRAIALIRIAQLIWAACQITWSDFIDTNWDGRE